MPRGALWAGYTPGCAWDTFVRAPGPPPPARTDLLVRRAAPGEAGAVAEVIRSAFGLPPAASERVAAIVGRQGWTFVVAEDDGALFSAAAVLIDSGAAWFRLGGTLLATETGAPGEAGPGPSYRSMLRAGFRVARRRENWQAPDQTRSAS